MRSKAGSHRCSNFARVMTIFCGSGCGHTDAISTVASGDLDSFLCAATHDALCSQKPLETSLQSQLVTDSSLQYPVSFRSSAGRLHAYMHHERIANHLQSALQVMLHLASLSELQDDV
jgi:hypothetical protein